MTTRTRSFRAALVLSLTAGAAYACSREADAEAKPPVPVVSEAPALSAAPAASAVPSAVTDGNVAFARDVYRDLAKSSPDLFLSPASLSTALAMTWGGARGKTATELANALHFTLPAAKEHEAYSALLARLSSTAPDSPKLTIANRLFANKAFPFEPAFVSLTRDRYAAPVEPLDFEAAPDPSRLAINAWVKKQTMDKIPELLQPGDVTKTTRLVLVDAIAFKAQWETPFVAENTKLEPFAAPSGSRKVPMMQTMLHARFADTPDAQIVELPYASKSAEHRMSMLVAVPKTSLADLDGKIDQVLSATLSSQFVDVALPKFTMRSRFDLVDELRKLGVHDAFDSNKADFSGITSKPIYVSNVIHEAFVSVDEKGTEAAAATAVLAKCGAAMPTSVAHVRADKPFFFALRDDTTGTILFMGRVSEPKT